MRLPISNGPSRALGWFMRVRTWLPAILLRWMRRRWLNGPAHKSFRRSLDTGALRGNPDHLKKLNRGAVEWNEWRRVERERGEARERIDLRGFNLRGRVLSDFDLRDADLQEAILRGAELRSNLRGALLLRADLRGANLRGASIDDKESDLRGCDFRECDVSEALLDQADMRSVRGLVLDSTRVRNARFSPTAGDPWSVLRRSYTGPRLGFNIILLLLFVTPYVAKTTAWIAVNRVQQNANQATSWIMDNVPLGESGVSVADRAIQRSANYLKSKTPSEQNGWHPYRVWQLLLGFDREATYWTTALALFIYNIGRAFLTYWVGPLRDEEERSGHSPAHRKRETDRELRLWHTYGWMQWPHRAVRALFLVAVGAFIVHTWSWMNLLVLLPP